MPGRQIGMSVVCLRELQLSVLMFSESCGAGRKWFSAGNGILKEVWPSLSSSTRITIKHQILPYSTQVRIMYIMLNAI